MCLFKCGKLNISKFFLLFTLLIFIRKSILISLKKLCSFEGTLVTAWLMFGGELLIGLCSIFIEYKKLINLKLERFLDIPLINSEQEPHHGKCMKVLLFFFCAFLDFCFFFFLNYNVTKEYSNLLFLLDIKLSSFQLIITSIICYFIFHQKIGLFQFFSLIFITISLIGIIFVEFYLRQNDDFIKEIKLLIYILGCYLLLGLQNCIEKYLMAYDNASPFQILFYEGIFGNIFMIIICFFNFEDKFIDKEKIEKLWILIIGFILYFFSSCFLNIYKLSVINESSPTNVPTCQNIIMLLILLYTFFTDNKYMKNVENNLYYLIVNSVGIIIIILGCLFFNEIIIFNCQEEKCENEKITRINDSIGGSQHKLDGSFTTEGDESF